MHGSPVTAISGGHALHEEETTVTVRCDKNIRTLLTISIFHRLLTSKKPRVNIASNTDFPTLRLSVCMELLLCRRTLPDKGDQ